MRRLTTEEVRDRLNKAGFDFVDPTQYKNRKEKVDLICLKCGTIFKRNTDTVINSKNPMCKKCKADEVGDRCRYPKEFILEKANLREVDAYCEDYKNSESKFKCKCRKCGRDFEATARRIRSDEFRCSCDRPRNWRLKSHDEFLSDLYAAQEYIDVCEGEVYDGRHVKLKFKCKICGHTWHTTPAPLLRGLCGCPKCASSKGEEYVRDSLYDFDIRFVEQHRFSDCVYQRPLIFDFYIPSLNLAIEVQGGQHFRPVKYFGGEDYFKKYQERDQMKRDYCKENNITLIELNYNNSNINKLKSEFEEKVVPLLG